MKKIFTLVFSILAFGLMAQTQLEEEKAGPAIVFAESMFDFGDIKQGDVVEHIFEFQNTGTQPLILSGVRTTCGCTAPYWPKEPIAPGETSSIKIKFNSRGKLGMQNKIITVNSNAITPTTRIKIVTNVKPPQAQEDGEG